MSEFVLTGMYKAAGPNAFLRWFATQSLQHALSVVIMGKITKFVVLDISHSLDRAQPFQVEKRNICHNEVLHRHYYLTASRENRLPECFLDSKTKNLVQC